MTQLTPADYDAWYDTDRGHWIGDIEYRLLLSLLEPQAGETLLDVGCGTGWFTRRFAALPDLRVTGIDVNREWLEYARSRDAKSTYLEADACALPFADDRFDHVMSITALPFVDDWRLAIREIVRVAKSRFAIALLNRDGLLWRDKGQNGGKGAYSGAHWHTVDELRPVFETLPVQDVQYCTAVFFPSASGEARMAETLLPNTLGWGSFLVVSGMVTSTK